MKALSKKDYEKFKKIAKLNQESLKFVMTSFLQKKYDTVVETKDYVYAAGDIPIGLVAHMDTVFSTPPSDIFYDIEQGVLWSPQGLGADDRAGVFSIVKILESNLRPHIILTTDEEVGGIGAEELAKQTCPFTDLNYLIELDRRGEEDCVFYDCDNKDFVKYVEEFGFKEAWGSFSDISILCPAWGVAGVNLSIGYRNEHSYQEVLYVAPMLDTVNKVLKMLQEETIPYFKYIPCESYSWLIKDLRKIQCDGCGKSFYEDELFPADMIDGQVSFFCGDCIVDEKNHITFCSSCYNAFEYEEDEALCRQCRGMF